MSVIYRGGQSPGYDQLGTFYNQYVVTWWKVSITGMRPNQSGDNAHCYYIYCSESPTLPSEITNANNISEQKCNIEMRNKGFERRSKIKVMGCQSTQNSGREWKDSYCSLSGTISKDMSVANISDNLPELSALWNANPSKALYGHIVFSPYDANVYPGVQPIYTVTLTQIAKLYDRNIVQDA